MPAVVDVPSVVTTVGVRVVLQCLNVVKGVGVVMCRMCLHMGVSAIFRFDACE
jgi:hypothetical protein